MLVRVCGVWCYWEGLRLQLVILASRVKQEDNKERRQSWTEYRVTVPLAGCVNLLNTPTTQYNSTEAGLISFSANLKIKLQSSQTELAELGSV